jgi:hypothetical protein
MVGFALLGAALTSRSPCLITGGSKGIAGVFVHEGDMKCSHL